VASASASACAPCKRWRRQLIGDGDGGHDRRKGSTTPRGLHQAEPAGAAARSCCLQPAAVRLIATGADRARPGRSGAVHRPPRAASTGCSTPTSRCSAAVEPATAGTKAVPRLRAAGANQVWSWDITYLPTTVRGIWLYLYLVIDVWSRKVVAWDVDEREDPALQLIWSAGLA
jgi:putative transposase